MFLAFLHPETVRNVLLAALGVCYLGYHVLRWLRCRPQEKAEGEGEVKVGGEGEAKVKGEGEQRKDDNSSVNLNLQHDLQPSALGPADEASSAGAEIFVRARAMMRQEVPDYVSDGLYLDLLGESAEQGYAPALAKLGEYAMRRETWVEAYYWMWKARKSGMHGLEQVMRQIRTAWRLAGFPDEAENVYELFDEVAGSIGRALIGIDSGRNAHEAREFLKAHHPEYLP